MCACSRVSWYTCGGQRTALWSCFSPTLQGWGIGFRWPGLHGKFLLSHRAVLAHNFSEEYSLCWTCGQSFSHMSVLTVAEPSSTGSCHNRPQISSLRSSEMATRGPCFSFQRPQDASQNPAVTLVPGNPVLSSDLCEYQAYMQCISIQAGKT